MNMSATNGTHGTHVGTQNNDNYEAQITALVKNNNKITRKQMTAELSVSLRTVQRIVTN